MSATLKDHSARCREQVLAEVRRRIARAAITLMNHAKELLSIAGTGRAGRDKKGRFKTRYGANPSAPGEPPHRQTGRLRASVTYEIEGESARVGTNVRYGRALEIGTDTIEPRPWLRRALADKQAELKQALAGGP